MTAVNNAGEGLQHISPKKERTETGKYKNGSFLLLNNHSLLFFRLSLFSSYFCLPAPPSSPTLTLSLYSPLPPLPLISIECSSEKSTYGYLNNRVFLSRNYRLIVAPWKFDVLKTNICPRTETSRANMLVLRTSDFQGATIRPIVPRHKHSIVFIVHH